MREATSVDNKPVIVVGAGLSGLSAAIYLRKFGNQVIVLEASDRPGGRVATDNIDGFLCDRGFQLINTRYPELRALGVVDEIDWIYAPRSVDVSFLNRTVTLGDPREGIRGIFDSATGTLQEKLKLAKFLVSSDDGSSSIGYQLKLAGLGTFYERVLKPFLTGVFLADPEQIDSRIGRKLIQHFVTGAPALARSGAAQLSRTLAARVDDIRYNVTVEEIEGTTVETSAGTFDARAIIVATDATTAAQLLGFDRVPQSNGCITWYHAHDHAPSSSKNLRLDGQARGPVVNSLVLSNLVPETAPAGQSLISSTTLLGASETDVRAHLSQMWGVSTHQWQLIAKYELRSALPLFAPGAKAIRQKIAENLYIAGDYCTEPSQNGALLAGRLAAQELALN